MEIVEDLPQVDAILVPYGSGALATGIACGVSAIAGQKGSNLSCRVVAVEPETAAPFHLSKRAGRPVPFDQYRSSFVDGCGGKSVLKEIWDLAKDVIDDGVAVSLESVSGAIKRLLESNRILAEGAGACPVAAALAGKCKGAKNIVCVISGGGLDTGKLVNILRGVDPMAKDDHVETGALRCRISRTAAVAFAFAFAAAFALGRSASVPGAPRARA